MWTWGSVAGLSDKEISKVQLSPDTAAHNSRTCCAPHSEVKAAYASSAPRRVVGGRVLADPQGKGMK